MNPKEIARIIDDRIVDQLNKLYTKQYQRGVVSAVAGNLASVKLEGNLTAYPAILCLSPYVPKVNDKVLVLSIGSSGANLLVIGKIDANAKQNPYQFSAYRNAAHSGGSPVKIVCDSEATDPNNNFNTTTGEYTVPVDGKYDIAARTAVTVGSGAGLQTYLYKNGALWKQGISLVSAVTGWDWGLAVDMKSEPLVAGDVIAFYAYTSGIALIVGRANTYFNGHLVSET